MHGRVNFIYFRVLLLLSGNVFERSTLKLAYMLNVFGWQAQQQHNAYVYFGVWLRVCMDGNASTVYSWYSCQHSHFIYFRPESTRYNRSIPIPRWVTKYGKRKLSNFYPIYAVVWVYQVPGLYDMHQVSSHSDFMVNILHVTHVLLTYMLRQALFTCWNREQKSFNFA